ncbi:hypothetical protein QTP86_024209 [Hemibagrus guttatus]|nr:hypothetical protein QTP86_024209 [Hemibagrus guttatus]
MKEMVVDFRRAQRDHFPLNIDESNVEIVKSTKFLGVPSITDIYSTRCICKANSIVDDSTHPSHTLFTLLPSGKRRLGMASRTTVAPGSGMAWVALMEFHE